MAAGTPHPIAARVGFLRGLGSTTTGLLAAGAFTYLFLSWSGRSLGAAAFAPVSSLWAMVFIVGPGLFLPVQQELGRILAAHRESRSGAEALSIAALLTGLMALATMVLALAARGWITTGLLNGHGALFWCFEGAIASWAVAYVARGVFSGLGDFRRFGSLITLEALLRLPVAAVMLLLHVPAEPSFGIAIAAAPLLSALVVTTGGSRLLLVRTGRAPGRDMTKALGWLVAGSLLAQFVANAGPLAVQVLAPASRQADAGRFLSALVIARIGFYLFQAVQAAILPNLAELAAREESVALGRAIRRLTAACIALVVVSTVGALAVGPFVVRLLFGPDFRIGAVTMAVLACASAIYILAAALNSAAIAASRHRLGAWSWLAGSVTFVGCAVMPFDLFIRVEVAYLVGALVPAAIFLLRLPRQVAVPSTSPTAMIEPVELP